ncbi:MAG: phosphoribosylaminoimidazolesuccinocarboxamide synthase [Nitrososphaeria archaeon]|nr:phosphoribosylaminoimidazolesuccinocarboxamide synthase [Nitrososphaeria archaeon]NIN52985.1 phosphoribosylaminoimidazolesuccinocarboxamide synthase [Nitrososphaeria archaeon]NIQ33544.1 phosphoribosylaminoimidazolesuccinocarboxamide synthase [Nitrososphaeria archaeon]
MDEEVILESKLPYMLLKRGKVRDVWETRDGSLQIFSTDRISTFDVNLPTGIPRKGESLHKLSIHWFERTRRIIPNHLIESIDDRTMRVRKAERIDIEWVVRSHLYGQAWRLYEKGERIISGVRLPGGLQRAEKLSEVILTPTTKADVGHDLEITKDQAIESGLVTTEEWGRLEEATLRLFEFYSRVAASKGIIIPDFKIEFGRVGDELIQIDEPPTHDSARLWALKHYRVGERQEGHALDKEFLRDYLIRVGFTGEGEPPMLPYLVVEEVSKRCVGAYEVLTGKTSFEAVKLRTVDQLMKELA